MLKRKQLLGRCEIKKLRNNEQATCRKIKQKIFHTKKVNIEKAIEVKNKLKINVDEQHIDMKHLKEKCDIDGEDKLQQSTASRTPMKKRKPVCDTCNQTFAMKNWLKKLFQKEHTKFW